MPITHDAVDLTVQPPAPDIGPENPSSLTGLPPSDMGPEDTPSPSPSIRPSPLLVTSSGNHSRPVQTCSLQNLHPPAVTSSACCSYDHRKWAVRVLLD